MFMDARKGMQYDDAGLFIKFSGDTCLTFWYNMKGSGAGSIEVIVDNDQQPALELKGPKDTNWHKEQVELTGVNKKVRQCVNHVATNIIVKILIFSFVIYWLKSGLPISKFSFSSLLQSLHRPN